MNRRSGLAPLAGLCLLPLAAQALQHRTYNATLHDRFTGFPAAPVANPSFLYAAYDFSGVAWKPTENWKQFTLITRQHVVGASHFPPGIGAQLRFVSSTGAIINRTVAAQTVVGGSDLMLITLNEPIDAPENVRPFVYTDTSEQQLDKNREMIVFGKTARAGRGVISSIFDAGAPINPSRVLRFTYLTSGSNTNDVFLESGDSGSPCFVLENGVPALAGTHSYISNTIGGQANQSTFAPHYADDVNTLLAPAGYRFTPAKTQASTLAGSASVLTAEPKQAFPLAMTVSVSNGNRETGNVEIEFDFPAGAKPEGITGSGWVRYDTGNRVTMRRAVMSASTSSSVTLEWSAAPAVPELAFPIVRRSDKTATVSASANIVLAPTFAAWAQGLADATQDGDPDQDGVTNLFEYALGGDPTMGGESILPGLELSGSEALVSFPERDDAAARGLTYDVEFSPDLSSGSWTSTPPPGLVEEQVPFDPPRPGFLQRRVSWPREPGSRFARLRVELGE